MKKQSYDDNLKLTYEGGCPSRCCYPKGYGDAKNRKIIKNECGYTWDGVPIFKEKYLNELPPHVNSLMVDIVIRRIRK